MSNGGEPPEHQVALQAEDVASRIELYSTVRRLKTSREVHLTEWPGPPKRSGHRSA